MAIRAHSVTPPTVPNRMSGCEDLDTPRIRFGLHPSKKYVILPISGSLVSGGLLFDRPPTRKTNVLGDVTRAVLVAAGLISTGYHNTDATGPKAPHRWRFLKSAAVESCW
jgi:hypothetical protein